MAQILPDTMRALVCEGVGKPLTLKDIPAPEPFPGSVVVKVIATAADPVLLRHLSGETGFTFPVPFVPGLRVVGRVVAIGQDTTSLDLGQLVLLDPFVRARDNPDVQILWGIYDGPSPQSKKFTADNWRNGGLAEYIRSPLENCWALNEGILCGELGYAVPDLLYILTQSVSYGGFRGIDLKAGETVLITPATGNFSGAAVGVAVAMGATVIAASRNLETLKKVQSLFPRVKLVQITGNEEEDAAAISKFGPVDAYLDLTPATVSNTTHLRSCFAALRNYGRASLMGTVGGDIPIPVATAMWKNLTIRGQYMYERDDIRGLIKLAESGALKLGKSAGQEIVAQFKLEEFEKAFELSAANAVMGKMVVLTP